MVKNEIYFWKKEIVLCLMSLINATFLQLQVRGHSCHLRCCHVDFLVKTWKPRHLTSLCLLQQERWERFFPFPPSLLAPLYTICWQVWPHLFWFLAFTRCNIEKSWRYSYFLAGILLWQHVLHESLPKDSDAFLQKWVWIIEAYYKKISR